MLYSLSISNYALINILDIEFSEGLTILTGETGAGKSIILGALSLVLGQRADVSVLRDQNSNAVVEACFKIPMEEGDLERLFNENQVDFSSDLIIRRVIYPGGKSRSFVNDQPVNLGFLKNLGNLLIDIHSQHENLLLADSDYPVKAVDAFAGLGPLSLEYLKTHRKVTALTEQTRSLRHSCEQTQKDIDYLSFQFQELQDAALETGEQEALENELKILEHAAEIRQHLFAVTSILQEGDFPVLDRMKEAEKSATAVASRYPDFSETAARLEQARIELKDLALECSKTIDTVQDNPSRLETVARRLDTIYSLERKHNLQTVDQLIELKDSLDKHLQRSDTDFSRLHALEKELNALTLERNSLASRLHKERVACLNKLSEQLKTKLALLGIPYARIEFTIEEKPVYGLTGNSAIEILFSANKDVPPRELSRIASGGEMSRLMLCIKTVIAQRSGLSTIIFDEVDQGVSGKIADRMGTMIHELSGYMQVLAITHLPQVAAKGNSHYLVHKDSESDVTQTRVWPLEGEERIKEVARMLSGSSITPAAMQNAKDLLHLNN
ncbi:MAG TPA: DNA repair protein RecN [Bacteroidales bacterium]|nr:DNA repair protein RecN [Bacteroidales bacterium]HRW94698.1 DNA repair protein RecN [Bacteroidales bacterium]